MCLRSLFQRVRTSSDAAAAGGGGAAAELGNSVENPSVPPESPSITPIPSPPPSPTPLYPDLDQSLVDNPEFRLTILRNFACPFRVESTCRHEDSPDDCIFGHPQTCPIGRLLDIPDYACIYYLLGTCKNERKVKQILNPNSNPTMPNSLARIVLHGCTAAIHLDPIYLVDLDLFEAQYAPIISEYFVEEDMNVKSSKRNSHFRSPQPRAPTPEDQDFECGICFDRIRSKYLRTNRTFALLEKCDHCFCGPCITQYRENQQNSNQNGQNGAAAAAAIPIVCPMCRVPSKRMFISERFIRSTSNGGEEKKRIFAAYKCQCGDE